MKALAAGVECHLSWNLAELYLQAAQCQLDLDLVPPIVLDDEVLTLVFMSLCT